jgi:hypothetical protein
MLASKFTYKFSCLSLLERDFSVATFDTAISTCDGLTTVSKEYLRERNRPLNFYTALSVLEPLGTLLAHMLLTITCVTDERPATSSDVLELNADSG